MNLLRRQIRKKCFNIVSGTCDDTELKVKIESQFTDGMNWSNFTFVWDISPNDPYKVIKSNEWLTYGGHINEVSGKYEPTGFTRQKIERNING